MSGLWRSLKVSNWRRTPAGNLCRAVSEKCDDLVENRRLPLQNPGERSGHAGMATALSYVLARRQSRFKNLMAVTFVLPPLVGNAVRAAGWMTMFDSKRCSIPRWWGSA